MGDKGPTEFEQAAAFRASLRRFHRISEDAARHAGLTPRRHLLLLMIKGAPGGAERSTVSELCERISWRRARSRIAQRGGGRRAARRPATTAPRPPDPDAGGGGCGRCTTACPSAKRSPILHELDGQGPPIARDGGA